MSDLGLRFAEVVSSPPILGTAFHEHGREPGVYLDCVGIIACALLVLGVSFEDYTSYSLTQGENRYSELVGRLSGVFTQVDDLQPGDVVAYRFDAGRGHGTPGHCCVYVGGGMIVEADARAHVRRVVKTVHPRNWREKILAMNGGFSVWRLRPF